MITSQETFVGMPRVSPGPVSASKERCLTDCAGISFASLPTWPGTRISCTVLSFASSTRVWWQSQTNLEFVFQLSRTVMTAGLSGLTFENSTWRSLYVECFVRISEETATFALHIINWFVFITLVENVYCAVRTDSLYKADYVSSLKG